MHAGLVGAVCALAACSSIADGPDQDRSTVTAGSVRLSRMNAADPILGQQNVWARADDWVLENEHVQFIISASPGSNGYVGYPGGLLDAFIKENGQRLVFDSLDEYWPLINGAPIYPDDVTISTSPETEEGVIALTFTGAQAPVPIELAFAGAEPELATVHGRVTYQLAGAAHALEVLSEVENVGPRAARLELGDFLLLGDDSAEAVTLPAGFDEGSSLTELAAIGSVSETHAWAALAYGADDLALARGSSVADQLARYDVRVATLAPGESLSARRWLGLGRDVAAALASRHPLENHTVRVTGHTVAGGTKVTGASVSFFEDEALTKLASQALTRDEGRFDVALAPGDYFAVASGRGNGEYVHVPGETRLTTSGHLGTPPTLVRVTAEQPPEVELMLAAAGSLRISVVDTHGQPMVAKLVFARSEPLPTPRISAGERQPYASIGIGEVHWTLGGTFEARLPPGEYVVTASCGPRRGLAIARGVMVDEMPRALGLELPDPVGPGGYFAIDSHLHGTDSQHGEVTHEERLITAMAEGLDVAISTDHDRIVDYGPVARALGIESALMTIPSIELTHVGHHNLWPLPHDGGQPNGGAIRWWFDDPGIEQLYARYRARGARVVQVNHGAGYFARAGYDLASGQVNPGAEFSFDFNAMELHNGKGNGGREALIPIWFSLLNSGRRVAPLAVSDSHQRIPEAGSGRTYVALEPGVAATPESIADAVVELRTVASTGPLIELLLDSGKPALGQDQTLAPGATLVLAVRVWAPAWIPIETVHLYANGEAVQKWNGGTSPGVATTIGADGLWFETRLSLQPDQDTWYVVEATGSRDLAPVYPGLSIWAMTAPVFLDADGTPGFSAPRSSRANP